jgi:hypothetical protein
MRLFLDDIRNPEMVGAEPSSRIARNFRAAIEIIEREGLPEHIYLDHDLGEDEPTGYDLVQYIINEYLLPTRSRFPSFSVHSANPVGRRNIEGLIASYHRYLESEIVR